MILKAVHFLFHLTTDLLNLKGGGTIFRKALFIITFCAFDGYHLSVEFLKIVKVENWVFSLTYLGFCHLQNYFCFYVALSV